MSVTRDPRLIYGFDPLCGWCFAFRPTMAALRAAYPELPIALRYGGLVVGERVAPVATSRDYLVAGLAEVRQRAGVAAGAAFYNGLLADDSYVSNSEPPCRAIWAAEQIAPERAYAFADALPEAFYGRGLAPDAEATLALLADEQGIDAAALLEVWRSDRARLGTQAAFARARAEGVVSYPTLFYESGGVRSLIARGWLAPDAAVARVARVARRAEASPAP